MKDKETVSTPKEFVYSYHGKDFTKKELVRIAKFQRSFILMVLINFGFLVLANIINSTAPKTEGNGMVLFAVVFFILSVIAYVAEIVSFFRLAIELKENFVLMVIAGFFLAVPCIGLGIAVLINSHVIKLLRAASIDVGFLGISSAEIDRME